MDVVMQQLQNMERAELIDMAGEFNPPIAIKASWNKRTIANQIRKRQIKDNPQQAAEPKQVKSEGFDDAVNELTNDDEPETLDGRGGPRPNAGRPEGSTDKELALTLETADENVRELIRTIAGFVDSTVEFSNEELDIVAVPYSKIYRYYVPTVVRNSIWMAFAQAAFGTMIFYRVIKAKAAFSNVQQKTTPQPMQPNQDPANLHGTYNKN